MIEDTLNGLRAVNVALTIATAFALAVRVNDRWGSLTTGVRTAYAGVCLFPLVGAYGSAEAYLQAAPVGARTAGTSIACAVTLLGLWRSRHDDPKENR